MATGRAARRPVRRGGRSPLPWLLGGQTLLLAGFMAAGLIASPVTASDTPLALLAGCLGAAAMGLQNAAGRLSLTKLTPHTVMTGNVTQLVLDATDAALGGADPGVRERLRKLFWPVLAFGAGALAGALAFVHVGFAALAPAIGAVAVLAWMGIAD